MKMFMDILTTIMGSVLFFGASVYFVDLMIAATVWFNVLALAVASAVFFACMFWILAHGVDSTK